MWILFFAYLTFLTLLAKAQQTVTTTDVNGQTVVAVIGTDPVALIPTTSIISTILPAATTATTAATATTATTATTTTPPAEDPDQQGPVGAPGPTNTGTGGPTPYTYTTVIGGVTYTSQDVFTPTNPPTLQPSIGASGTVWDFSAWQSVYGAQTTGKNAASPKARIGGVSTPWAALSLSTITGVAFGAWIALF